MDISKILQDQFRQSKIILPEKFNSNSFVLTHFYLMIIKIDVDKDRL
ncbi:Uncharacterized protein dnl_54770 [Desulfonema limicola]|uniref:Uncharacterized protein n=1 Tax=Desulfonema limicola TaxID=45656 RepID=A0A975GJ48_9BACT|nr:Uncharacterized protein dnl_54770 [Desulfonema limicola]